MDDLVCLGVLTKHQKAVYSLCGMCTTSVALLLNRKLGYVCFCFCAAKITFNLYASISVSICVKPCVFYYDSSCDWVAFTCSQ